MSSLDLSKGQLEKIENLSQSLQKLFCICKQMKRIENLPLNVREFACCGNQITTIENLPLGLQVFYCRDNQITHVDNVEYSRVKFTLKGYQSIKHIQRRTLRLSKSNKSILQDVLEDWVWKPMCLDSTIGIRPRIDTDFLGL